MGPCTAPPGAPADLNPPSALPEWAVVTGGSCGARPRYCSGARVAPVREQVQPHPPPPPPASRPFWGGGGGRPLGSGGAEGRSCGSQAGGGCGKGGGGAAPPPPHPVGRRPAFRCPRHAPPGHTRAMGVAGRPRASGAVRSAANGSVRRGGGGGGGGGNPPALVRAPVFPGPASDKAAQFAPSWAPQVRRRPAAGRACGRLPRPWCPRTPGAAASSGGLRVRRFFGLPLSALGPEWVGRGGVGGASGPQAPPPDSRGGGRHGGPIPGCQPSAGGSHPSPAPLYLEPDPRAGPRWGPTSPRPSSRGAGRPGAAVMVSGQRLAGCGAAGSPPRSLSPPSLPREVARAPASRRTVGGAWVGGPSPPPPLSRVRRLGRHLRRRLCGGWGCDGGGLCQR